MLAMKKELVLIGLISCLLIFFKNNVWAIQPFSGDFSIGLYRSFAKPHDGLPIQDRFNLRSGFSLSLSFFKKSLWDSTQLHHRTGLGIGYQILRGTPVKERYQQQFFENAIPDRIYHKFSIRYLIQIKILQTKSSRFILDCAGSISLMTYDDKGQGSKPCNNSFICINPVPNLGIQAGVTYYVKIKTNWGVKMRIVAQLHSSKGAIEYPFSKGIIFETGIAFNR